MLSKTAVLFLYKDLHSIQTTVVQLHPRKVGSNKSYIKGDVEASLHIESCNLDKYFNVLLVTVTSAKYFNVIYIKYL